MKAPALPLLVAVLIGGGCAQTAGLHPGNTVAEQINLNTEPVGLVSIQRNPAATLVTPIELSPAAAPETKAAEFSLTGGNHLVLATLGREHGRASAELPLAGVGLRQYRLDILRDGQSYRFQVWDLTVDPDHPTLAATAWGRVRRAGIRSGSGYDPVGHNWDAGMNSVEHNSGSTQHWGAPPIL